MFFIVGQIACMDILHSVSEEQNYLVGNTYGTEHAVTSVAILQGPRIILFSSLFSVSAPLVKLQEQLLPCISKKKKSNQKLLIAKLK